MHQTQMLTAAGLATACPWPQGTQGYARLCTDSGNPWQSMAIPKLPSDTNKCEQFTQAPSLACQSSEFRNLQGHSGYASKLSEKNLKAGTSSFLKNFCMMFSSTCKLQSFPLNAWKSCRKSNENRENSFQKTDLRLVLVAPPKVPWPKPHQIEVGATAEPGRETQMERSGVSADSGVCSIIYIYNIYYKYYICTVARSNFYLEWMYKIST